WHIDVHYDQRELRIENALESFLSRSGVDHVHIQVRQNLFKREQVRFKIVNYKQSCFWNGAVCRGLSHGDADSFAGVSTRLLDASKLSSSAKEVPEDRQENTLGGENLFHVLRTIRDGLTL